MATYSFEISATCSTLKVSLHFRFLRYPYGVESAKVARKLQRPNAFDTAVQLANEFDDAVGEALEKAKAEDAAEAERVAKLSFADRELYAVEGLTNAIMKTASQLLERSNPTLTSNPHSMWSQLVRSISAAVSVAFVRHMTCPGCQDFADCPDHGEGMITRGMSTLDSIAPDVDVGHMPRENSFELMHRARISEEGLRTQTEDEVRDAIMSRTIETEAQRNTIQYVHDHGMLPPMCASCGSGDVIVYMEPVQGTSIRVTNMEQTQRCTCCACGENWLV